MRRLWKKYLNLLDMDFSARVFENVKNLTLCALLFAAGTSALQAEHSVFLSLLGTQVTGVGLIIVSALLMFLNISDALNRVARMRYHIILQLILWAFYLILALRIVEIVWTFQES